jgi:hypothetical protein
MFKFFRRYNKWILVFGGTLLLITFLIPEAIQGLSNSAAQRGATWAHVGADEQEITLVEFDQLRRELRVIESLRDGILGQLGVLRKPEHWYLLVREAEQAGLIGGPADGRMHLASIAARSATADQPAPTEAQAMALLQAETHESPPFIIDSLAKLRGVHRLLELQMTAAKLSDRRISDSAAEMMTELSVELVPVKADAKDSTYEPTQAELEEQLKTYGEFAAGAGKYGFGYRHPHRVKLEWMTIPMAAIRASIDGSEAVDGVAVAKYWQKNQAKFPVEPGSTGGFEAVRDQVRESLLSELTSQKMAEIAKFAGDQILSTLLPLQRDGIHYVLPENWASRDVPFTTLSETLASEFKVAVPSVTPFTSLVRMAKELDGSTSIPIQKNVASPPLKSSDGSIHFFRIVDVNPSHAPTSVDEVRDALVADIRTMKRYEQLKSSADEIRRQAIDEGLISVAVANGAVVESVTRLSPVGNLQFRLQGYKLPSMFGSLGDAPGLIEELARRASRLSRTVRLADLPDSERTFAEPVDDKLTVAVVRINAISPLTKETFDQYVAAGFLQSLVLQDERQPDVIVKEFGYDALAARHKFKPAGAGRDESTADATPTG